MTSTLGCGASSIEGGRAGLENPCHRAYYTGAVTGAVEGGAMAPLPGG